MDNILFGWFVLINTAIVLCIGIALRDTGILILLGVFCLTSAIVLWLSYAV
jgi:hypothetical protein